MYVKCHYRAETRVSCHSLARAPANFVAVSQRAAELLRNWRQLSKFKLSALVVASSAAGFVAGSGERVDWSKLAWTSLGTMGAAASANTLNQVTV